MSTRAPRAHEVSRRLTVYERVVFAVVIALTIGALSWEFSRIAANRRTQVNPVEAVRHEVLKTDTAAAAPTVGSRSVH